MPTLHVCGEALVDFLAATGPDGRRVFQPAPGGSPCNLARAAARAGARVRFIGPLSTDLFGGFLAQALTDAGVDIAGATRSDAPSTLAFADLTGGEARYAFFNRGSALAQARPRLAARQIGPGDILAVGSISLIDRPGADAITRLALRAAGRLMLSFDPNVRLSMVNDRSAWMARMAALMGAATIIKLSVEDLAALAPGTGPDAFAAARLAAGAALVLVTAGEAGATLYAPGTRLAMPAPPVALRDTVGAGDTFLGVALAWLMRQGLRSADAIRALPAPALAALLAEAIRGAAINCTRDGCDPPTLAELQG